MAFTEKMQSFLQLMSISDPELTRSLCLLYAVIYGMLCISSVFINMNTVSSSIDGGNETLIKIKSMIIVLYCAVSFIAMLILLIFLGLSIATLEFILVFLVIDVLINFYYFIRLRFF